MNRLIVYGDSWPSAENLENPELDAFPYLIGKNLNLEVINLSVRSTSIDHVVYYLLLNYKRNFHNSNDRVLFCLTGRSRAMYFDQDTGAEKEIHPRKQTITDVSYFKYIHSEYLDDYNYQKNVLLCHFLCKDLGIKSYFVSNWDAVPKDLFGKVNFYSKSLLEILYPAAEVNMDLPQRYNISLLSEYIDDTNHPNKQGHQKIAKELSLWIS